MRCISPLLIRNSGRRDFVPCGKCNYCLQVKRGDWSFRLLQELKVATSARFLTMTYTDDRLPRNHDTGLPELCKRDVQLFFKRVRKDNAVLTDQRVRYYAVGEYGTKTARPHYHAIVFNLHDKVIANLMAIWTHGHVHAGTVSAASIHYVTKYVINRETPVGGREPPFALMSRRPGIGANYLGTHTLWHRAASRNFTQVNGMIARLPRYYKDQIFTAAERRRMAREAVRMSDQEYLKAIEELSRFQPDPCAYYDEAVAWSHDKVISKLNSKNLF